MAPKMVDPKPTGNLSVAKFLNKADPNNGKHPAIMDLNKSFPAKTEAK